MKKCIKAVSLLVLILAAISVFAISAFAACTGECSWYLRDTLSTPTCTKTGTEKWMCSDCGASEYRYPAALGHSWYHRDTLSSPTCTERGTEKWACSVCGITEYRYNDALGHSMSNRTYCSQTVYCQRSDCDYKETGSCSFGAWRVTVQPSCTKSGTKTRACTECGVTESGVISALGHSYGSWRIETEAECEVEGYQVRSCGTCGDTDYAVVPALGHSYGSWQTVTAASCTSLGEQKRVCSECGKTETKSIAALGHKYVNNVCSVCGDDKMDELTTAPDETTKAPGESTTPSEETTEPSESTTETDKHTHNYSAWKKLDEKQHSAKCQDPDCSDEIKKNHTDTNFDGKCDGCGCDYSTELSMRQILGISLGAAALFGILFLLGAIVKARKE